MYKYRSEKVSPELITELKVVHLKAFISENPNPQELMEDPEKLKAFFQDQSHYQDGHLKRVFGHGDELLENLKDLYTKVIEENPYITNDMLTKARQSIPDEVKNALFSAMQVKRADGLSGDFQYWDQINTLLEKTFGAEMAFEDANTSFKAYEKWFSEEYTWGAIPRIQNVQEVKLDDLIAKKYALDARAESEQQSRVAPRQNMRTGKPKFPYFGHKVVSPNDPDLL